ncbi:LacI family transcriptional regulator [Nibricoccus aquaticus]|uniref:LacI family transcriptional regulator n=1 Tax=Nibricoccus aquaticus TaxID=2576891 RepID=A0A290QH77_9BACT|nr:LacI family DNA-binding transcriptional regulator [Nibricoccus aquaticus]ATC63711.1 LacI family transcriptional regulator [Nibricoccus aquaticus]
MPPKATLNDVAKRAGVHRSTVSLALRDHPRISEPVRLRIQGIAKKIGYRINPLVAALMQARRTKRAEKHVVLAYVTNHPTRFGWRPPHHNRPDYFPGATARARDFGYKIEHFWLAEPGMNPERFASILTARNINGLIIGRLPPGCHQLELPWERFSCVALGLTLHAPRLHHVTENHYSSAKQSMTHCIARGYRRIGFVFSEANDSPRVGERWLGAYLHEQLRLEPADRITPFLFKDDADNAAIFREWFRHNQPDALLVTHAPPVIEWLKPLGKTVPRDVGLVALVNDHPEQNYAGVHYDPAKLGALGIEMLIGLLHRDDTGIPSDQHEVLLTGEWLEGRTLRPAAAPAAP